MSRKRVLVVDDSKSARVILSRMLEKYDIEVDMEESAELALVYLQSNRPDAIFMDHLMPGMDGLQAVKLIKGNAQTAMIPVMMYTSQEGELYVGQARALGAMGVLPKQVRPVDVSKVLYELHLLPDRRDLERPALVPVELQGGTPVEAPAATTPAAVVPTLAPNAPDWTKRVETAVKDQAVDIRRFIVASLDSFAARIVSDLRDTAPPAPTPADQLAPPPRPEKSSLPFVVGIAAALLAALAFGAGWYLTREELDRNRAELASLNASNTELQRARLDLTATVKDLTAALAAANNAAAPASPFASGQQPAASRIEPVPYGEIPFDRSRLDALREMLNKLEAQQFHGTVHVANVAGTFCLTGNSTDGYVPAAATLPVARCDLIGNPFEDSLGGQQRQSLGFANLIAGVRQRTSGAITVVMDNASVPRTASAYPARTESLTAGEWNRAAAANNRVEFFAESGPAPPAATP